MKRLAVMRCIVAMSIGLVLPLSGEPVGRGEGVEFHNLSVRQNTKEELRELLQRCFNVRYVGLKRRRSVWDGKETLSGNALVPYGLSIEQRISALQKLTLPAAVIYVAIFDMSAEPAIRGEGEISGTLYVRERAKNDPLYVAAKKRLLELCLEDFYTDIDGSGFGHGVGRGVTHYQCTHECAWNVISVMVPRPETRFVSFQSCIRYEVPDYNHAVKVGAAGRGFEFVFESLAAGAGQKKLYEFLKQDDSQFSCIARPDETFSAIRCDDEKSLLDLVSWLYRGNDAYTKTYSKDEAYQKLKQATYACLSSEVKKNFAVLIASREPDERASSGYDFAFEKRVFAENAAILRQTYGVESNMQLEPSTLLGKFYGLIYNDVSRPTFDGMFGMKFGVKADVSKAEMVSAFGFDFYRVPFVPQKKSKAFEYYDLWVTKITHKVFAVQGRSKNSIVRGEWKSGTRNVPPLVASLEKKYQNMSVNFGPGWMFAFPVENSSLRIIESVKGSANSNVNAGHFWASAVAGQIFGERFGNAALAESFAEKEKIRASVSNYLMSDLDKEIGCTVVAESAELAALAEKESKIAREEATREVELRKQIEAQSAADAF